VLEPTSQLRVVIKRLTGSVVKEVVVVLVCRQLGGLGNAKELKSFGIDVMRVRFHR
jgi:hypothetical protein